MTDGQTDRILIAIPRLHYMQRGKNVKVSFLVLRSLDYLSLKDHRELDYLHTSPPSWDRVSAVNDTDLSIALIDRLFLISLNARQALDFLTAY